MRLFCTVIVMAVLCTSPLLSEESYIDSTKIKDPELAWKLSIIPGLGQIYNGKYIKAAAIMGGQYYATSRFLDLKQEGNITKRNTFAWWILGLFIYSTLDAYVDAQLSSFPVPAEDDTLLHPNAELQGTENDSPLEPEQKITPGKD